MPSEITIEGRAPDVLTRRRSGVPTANCTSLSISLPPMVKFLNKPVPFATSLVNDAS
jgi:hypothetical protein